MQVSLASAVGESAEASTDMHVSRTVSLNGDSALLAAAQKGEGCKYAPVHHTGFYAH